MSKYKIIHGFALSNDRCMKKLEKYSAEGWYFKKYLVFFMLLEKGEKKKCKYRLLYEKKFDKEREEFYAANGWQVVRNSHFWQILRGEADAVELYTDAVSEKEMWKQRIKFNSILAAIFIIVGILFTFASTYIRNNEFVDFIGGMGFGAGLTMEVIIICFCFKYLSLDKKSYNEK